MLEEDELCASQDQRSFSAMNFMGLGIQGEVGNLQNGRGFCSRPAGSDPQACREDFKRKRFGEIVVGQKGNRRAL